MAKNDHDKTGRSLEEQLASLDAMNNDVSADEPDTPVTSDAPESDEAEAPLDVDPLRTRFDTPISNSDDTPPTATPVPPTTVQPKPVPPTSVPLGWTPPPSGPANYGFPPTGYPAPQYPGPEGPTSEYETQAAGEAPPPLDPLPPYESNGDAAYGVYRDGVQQPYDVYGTGYEQPPLPPQYGQPPQAYEEPPPAPPQPYGAPGPYGPPGYAGPPQGMPPQAPPGPPPQAPPGQPQPQQQYTADSLNAENLLRGRRQAPAAGWRRAIFKASGGMVHPGDSPGELRRRDLVQRARTPVAGGHHRVAVMSLKGGVGKTTTTVGLGSTLASVRGDRIIAVDANPDRGTLSDKVRLETAATVRDLLNERQNIQRYADVRAFTSQATSRLELLASDRDPAVSEAFSEADYRAVSRVLEHFYSICLTDCGTGLLHSAMAGVLSLADQLVLVSSPSVDGARSASATLDWLEAHHYGDLVRSGVVVLSMVRSRSKSSVDLDRLQAHFESRCRAVVRTPYDPHLEEGAEVELEELQSATREAYLLLAATVGDGFAWQQPH